MIKDTASLASAGHGHASSDCTSSSLRVLIDLAFRNFG